MKSTGYLYNNHNTTSIGERGMTKSVIDVHRDYLDSHRFVQKYDSGYKYLHNEIDISESEIPDGYRDIEVEHMYRMHTGSSRQFMFIQKNPNLKPGRVSGSIHGPHTHLSEWNGDTVQRNIEHSRTTVSSYLNNSRMEIVLQTLANEFGAEQFGFGPSIKENGMADYLRTDINEEYDNSPHSPIIKANEGFFGDFAYSNAMKFQGPTDKVSPQPEDDEWLKNEIAAISPRMILCLGVPARKSLQRIGFEQTNYSGPFNRDEGKIYAYNGSGTRLQGILAISVYHLGARESHDELKEAFSGAVQAAKTALDFEEHSI